MDAWPDLEFDSPAEDNLDDGSHIQASDKTGNDTEVTEIQQEVTEGSIPADHSKKSIQSSDINEEERKEEKLSSEEQQLDTSEVSWETATHAEEKENKQD